MNKNEVIRIIDAINNISELSSIQEEILDFVLICFSANKTKEINSLNHLLNEDTYNLLKLLDQSDILDYASEEFDLIYASDESDLVDALENMNYKFIEAVDEDDMVEYLENCGYSVSGDKEDNLDIVTQSDLDELVSNFLSADFEKRKLMLKL